jgi:hypothetical protein
MPDEVINSVWAALILFLLPINMCTISRLLFGFLKRGVGRGIRLQPPVFSVNFAYAYFAIDALITISVCLSLHFLTYRGEENAIPPAAAVARWGGIILTMAYCSLDFPIRPAVKLLWPILRRWKGRPKWIKQLNGIRCTTLRDLFIPWIKGLKDGTNWTGTYVLGGAVAPYLGILSVAWLLWCIKTTMGLSQVAQMVFALFSLLCDWGGALVVLTLMLNLLFFIFPTTTIGEILKGLSESRGRHVV